MQVLVQLGGGRMRSEDRLNRLLRQLHRQCLLELADKGTILIGADGDRARFDSLEQSRQSNQRFETSAQRFDSGCVHRSVLSPRVGATACN